MKTTVDIYMAVSRWTDRRFLLRASYYTGRPPSLGDLNPEMLEGIYNGLRNEIGREEAKSFVNFVSNLRDLSASAFVQAFERFWASGCKMVRVDQRPGSGNELTGHGEAVVAEAFALLGMTLGGGTLSPEGAEWASRPIKEGFLRDHQHEIER